MELPSLIDVPGDFVWPTVANRASADPIIARVFRLGQQEWTRLSRFSRTKLLERQERRITEACAKLPESVTAILRVVLKDGLALQVMPFPFDAEGPHLTGSGRTVPIAGLVRTQTPMLIVVPIYLLFAPPGVFLQIVVHEIAHVYVAAARDPAAAPQSNRADPLGFYTPAGMAEEDVVDRLVEAWGYGKRNMHLDAWFSAVTRVGRLDCQKEYREELKRL